MLKKTVTKAHLPSRVELVRLIFGKDLEELRQSAKEKRREQLQTAELRTSTGTCA